MGAWVLALASVLAFLRKRFDAVYVSLFAAEIITLVGGLSDIAVLSASAVPFAFRFGWHGRRLRSRSGWGSALWWPGCS